MIIEAFMLCDAATDSAGKLNVLGAYDSIGLVSFPAKVQTLVVAMRVRYLAEEIGRHRIQVNTIDYDGRLVLTPFSAELHVHEVKGRASAVTNLIVTAANLQFERPGAYRMDALIDEKVLASIPLFLERHPG